MESLNHVAVELVDEAIDYAAELNVNVTHVENDATIIDCGVGIDGGIEAGMLFTEIQTGGLGRIHSRLDSISGVPWTCIEFACDHPERLIAVQRPAQVLDHDGFTGVISGPVQLLLGEEVRSVEEEFDFTVVTCYSDELPTAATARRIAEMTGTPQSGVFFVVCSFDSLSSRVSLAASMSCDVLSAVRTRGIEASDMLGITTRAPIPPNLSTTPVVVTANDAIRHGGTGQVMVTNRGAREEAVEELEFESWFTDQRFSGEGRADASMKVGSGFPLCTMTIENDDTLFLGQRNEEQLREAWFDQSS